MESRPAISDNKSNFKIIHENDFSFLSQLTRLSKRDPLKNLPEIRALFKKQTNEFCHAVDKKILIAFNGTTIPVTITTILTLMKQTEAAELLVKHLHADSLWIAFGMGLQGKKIAEKKDIHQTLINEMGLYLNDPTKEYQLNHQETAAYKEKELSLFTYAKGLTNSQLPEGIMSLQTREIFKRGRTAGGHPFAEQKISFDRPCEIGAIEGRRMDLLQKQWDDLTITEQTPKELEKLYQEKQKKLLDTIINHIGNDFTALLVIHPASKRKNVDDQLLSLMESLDDTLDEHEQYRRSTFRKAIAQHFSQYHASLHKSDFPFLLPEKCAQIHAEMSQHDLTFKEARKSVLSAISPNPALLYPILQGDDKEGLIQDIIMLSYFIKQKNLPQTIHHKLADVLEAIYFDLKTNATSDIIQHKNHLDYMLKLLIQHSSQTIFPIDVSAGILKEKKETYEKNTNHYRLASSLLFYGGIALTILSVTLGLALCSGLIAGIMLFGAAAFFTLSKCVTMQHKSQTLSALETATITLSQAKDEHDTYQRHRIKKLNVESDSLQSPQTGSIELAENIMPFYHNPFTKNTSAQPSIPSATSFDTTPKGNK